MGFPCIKFIGTLSGSSFYQKIMQKYHTDKKNTSRFPKMNFYTEKICVFSKKIIDKNRKWKKMAVTYPLFLHSAPINILRVFQGTISFFLSFNFHYRNQKFINIHWNILNQLIIKLKPSLYQSKIETKIKNHKKIFLSSNIQSKNVNIKERNNKNDFIKLFKSGTITPDKTIILKDTFIQKSNFLKNKFLGYISELSFSGIENNINRNIEKLSIKIKNSNSLLILKMLLSKYYLEVYRKPKNSKILKKVSFSEGAIFATGVDNFWRQSTLQYFEFLSRKRILEIQYLLNPVGSLNNSIFSTGINCWNKSSFSNSMLQLRNVFVSKTSSLIHMRYFTEKPIKTDSSSAKKIIESKKDNFSYYHTINSKMLKVRKSKNMLLFSPLELPENIQERLMLFSSNVKELSKSFLSRSDSTHLNEPYFLKNMFDIKFLNLSALDNNFYNKYFVINFSNQLLNTRNHFYNRCLLKFMSNQSKNSKNDLSNKRFLNYIFIRHENVKNNLYSDYFFNNFSNKQVNLKNNLYNNNLLNNFGNQHSILTSSNLSTNFNHLGNLNLNFGHIVHKFRNAFFSEVSSFIHAIIFSKKSLRIGFSTVKKINKKEIDNKYSTKRSRLFKVLCSENVHLKFESITNFPFLLLNLALENLIFPVRYKDFSFLISQKPANLKKSFIPSLHDLEMKYKETTYVYKNKNLSFFTSRKKISNLSQSNYYFKINGEDLVFHTQFDMEKRLEEKIDQNIRQKTEQIEKTLTNINELSAKQYLTDYSAKKEFQKQFLDMNYISDQVFRLIEHRLIIERERRGIL